jgi:hypothetical protein
MQLQEVCQPLHYLFDISPYTIRHLFQQLPESFLGNQTPHIALLLVELLLYHQLLDFINNFI